MNKIFGYEKEKAQIEQIKKLIKNIDEYRKSGVRIPRGLVLYGEPGVGKTSLAMSLLDEGVNLVRIKLNCNSSEDEIHKAFEDAKTASPTIALIDELDKIAGTSMIFYMPDNDRIKKVLIQEIDALSENDGIMIVATCNDIDIIGDTLLRPGRFDRVIHIDLPTESDRKAILENYFNKLTLSKNFDMENVVKYTAGCTGADIECIVNESGIMAISENKTEITEEHIHKVMNRMAFQSDEKEMLENRNELYKIAVHEAGHAFVALTETPENVISATIRPQGSNIGHVRCLDDEDYLPSIQKLKSKIAIALGGRIAEREVFSDIFLGSSSDVNDAYLNARALITKHAAYGYDLVNAIPCEEIATLSNNKLVNIEEKIADILDEADKKVSQIIKDNRETLIKIANGLMEKTALTKDELLAYFPKNKKISDNSSS